VIEAAPKIKGVAGENLRKALDWLPTGRKLVTVRCDCDLAHHVPGWPAIGALAQRPVQRDDLLAFYTRFGFKTLKRELEEQIAMAGRADAEGDLVTLMETASTSSSSSCVGASP
jgi:DNA polymerase-1